MRDILEKEIRKRILVLDGATGSEIQKYNLSELDYRGERFAQWHMPIKGNNEILNITRSDIIYKIHRDYLEAGADIIETNTFNCNSISQAHYSMEDLCEELNAEAVRIARRAREDYLLSNTDKQCFIAGSIGPTNKSASLSSSVNNPALRDVDFDMLKESYYRQAKVLIEEGVDILLVETVFDTINAKAALLAIKEIEREKSISIAVMLSFTISDASGRTLSGQSVEAFLNSVSHFNLFSIGINCALGAKEIRQYIEELSRKATFYISCHPNAGLPNEFGEYEQSPKEMAVLMKDIVDSGFVNIVGGCCGTNAEHIRLFSEMAIAAKVREIPSIEKCTRISGLEAFNICDNSAFINIAERTNVSGSRKFARLIREKKYEQALFIAREQIDNGAQIIDVNMDDSLLDAVLEMRTFLNILSTEPDIAKVPIMIDSSNWDVLLTGLKCLQSKSIVNSISLKEGEKRFLEQARTIKDYGAALVFMAFDERGQADTFERKIEICKRAYYLLKEKIDFPCEDIIFDVNVLTIGTGIDEHNNYGLDFLRACEWIKKNLPYARVSAGVSNLSFAFRGNNFLREAIHSVFLYQGVKVGLDMAIVNASSLPLYESIEIELRVLIEDLIFNRREDATERIISYSNTYLKDYSPAVSALSLARETNVDDRLKGAVLSGNAEFLDCDLLEAKGKYERAIDIIEGPLMDSMNELGVLFGEGKMFLPQVLKSARVMKKAVDILSPLIKEQNGTRSSSAGKILLATVKGDVHDIGKNIAGIVLACNNYEIVDLGVMVPSETILDEALRQNVDIICLSGLISPSLGEMEYIASEMKRRKLNIPLIIGGATTSKTHTAVKIDVQSDYPVVHVKDASQNVAVANNLLNIDKRKDYIESISKEYTKIRNEYALKEYNLISIDEARARMTKDFLKKKTVVKPKVLGQMLFNNFSICEIKEFINWTYFFKAWSLKSFSSGSESSKIRDDEKEKLFNDANYFLNLFIENSVFKADAVLSIFPANSMGESIVVYDNNKREEICRLEFLRRQKASDYSYPSLADYIADVDSGVDDYMAAFAVSVDYDTNRFKELFPEDDAYSSLMLQTLSDRLVEAFAELLHFKLRTEYWGYASDEACDMLNILKGNFRGIRPAPGYPACPDHSEKLKLFKLLDVQKNIGLQLTENYAMYPPSSICAYCFADENSKYFGIDKIGIDQLEDYALRKDISVDEAKKLVSNILV